jgi:histone acetyltransferase MYST1
MPSHKKDASQKKEKKQKAAKPDEKPAGEPEFVEPYREGLFILCRWEVDGTTRNAEVIEAILDAGAAETDLERWSYYVHYTDFNRRMDEWVRRERVLGKGVKVDAHAHDKKEEGDGERDELTMAGAGGGSGSLSATLHKHNKSSSASTSSSSAEDPDKKKSEFTEAEEEEHEGMDDASLREHEEVTKVKNVKHIELGRHLMETWYFSPFPKEFWQDGPIDTLYCCEFSLNFFKHKAELERFQKKKHCPRHPPANEIYRAGGVSMFEVNPMDSMQAHHYAQVLNLLVITPSSTNSRLTPYSFPSHFSACCWRTTTRRTSATSPSSSSTTRRSSTTSTPSSSTCCASTTSAATTPSGTSARRSTAIRATTSPVS